jgi:hypothetical protein
MNPIRARPAFALALACAWMLAACGGSDDASAPPPAAFIAETKSGVIGTAGGSVTLSLTNGTVFDLSLPAGAVKADTTFVLTTQEPIAGQRFNLRLQPEGLVFAQGKVATVLVTLPASQTLPVKAGFAYRGKPVPFTLRPDGKLQIELTSLTGGHSAVASTGRAAALAASRQPLAAPSAATCGGAPELGADGEAGLVAADAVEIEVYGQCMVAAVQALAANEQFSEAVSAALSVAAYLQRTGSGDAAGFINRAGDYTCIAYAAALDRARNTTVEGMGTFYRVTKPIMFWEKVRSGLGFECPGIGDTTYQDVINDKVGQAIVYYESQKSAIVDTHDANYLAARTEAADGSQATAEVLALNPGPGLRATLDAQIVQRAQPSVLDALLQAPWASCRNNGSYDELIDLMRSLDSPPAVQRAAQYCATQLNVRSRDANSALADDLAPELGGVSAASTRTGGAMYVPKDGKLFISGPVGALKCPRGSGSSDEGLRIKLDSAVLQTLTPPYFDAPLQIDMVAAIQAAALDAKATKATLSIERIGSPCAGFWGENPAPLVKIDLNFNKYMTVTPTRAFSYCGTPPDGRDEVQIFATDLSFPFGFSAAPCGAHSTSESMVLTDQKTLVFSEDYVGSPVIASPHTIDKTYFDVEFLKTGVATITLNLGWFVPRTDCERRKVDSHDYVYLFVISPSAGRATLAHTLNCPFNLAELSLPVTAGEKVSFETEVTVNGASTTGSGAMFTIRFDPAP